MNTAQVDHVSADVVSSPNVAVGVIISCTDASKVLCFNNEVKQTSKI